MPRLHSLLLASLLVGAAAGAQAAACTASGTVGAILVEIGDGNAGINSCSYSYLPAGQLFTVPTLSVSTTYGNGGPGSLKFSGLDVNQTYQALLSISNNSSINFSRIGVELLDRAGDGDDAGDDLSPPGLIPPGWSPSSNADGLSFAQNIGNMVLNSDRFATVTEEVVGGRDFIDFSGGAGLNAGGDGILRFGLIAQETENQPFLLVQRPNQQVTDPVVPPDPGRVPEPATLALLAAALLALAVARRRPT